MATANRCWRLIARPKGDNFRDALKFTSQTMDQLGFGVLPRTIQFQAQARF
jgi:hypothetical protein